MVVWDPKLGLPINAVYLITRYVHSISLKKMAETKLRSACSLFIYIMEYAGIYIPPSWVHLFKQRREKGEKETDRKRNATN